MGRACADIIFKLQKKKNRVEKSNGEKKLKRTLRMKYFKEQSPSPSR